MRDRIIRDYPETVTMSVERSELNALHELTKSVQLAKGENHILLHASDLANIVHQTPNLNVHINVQVELGRFVLEHDRYDYAILISKA